MSAPPSKLNRVLALCSQIALTSSMDISHSLIGMLELSNSLKRKCSSTRILSMGCSISTCLSAFFKSSAFPCFKRNSKGIVYVYPPHPACSADRCPSEWETVPYPCKWRAVYKMQAPEIFLLNAPDCRTESPAKPLSAVSERPSAVQGIPALD